MAFAVGMRGTCQRRHRGLCPFLAAGLIWSLTIVNPFEARSVQLFFLSCVTVAGCYGAWTVNRRIFFVQALPAIPALFRLLYIGY